MTHSASNGPGRGIDPCILQPFRKLAIGHRHAVGDIQQRLPDCLAKGCSLRSKKGQGRDWILAEIGVQPGGRFTKYRKVWPLLRIRRKG